MDTDLLKTALDWSKHGLGVAIATVVQTWGSAPRPVGAMLVIDESGNFEGSVSGGCVEGAVIQAAQDAIASQTGALLEFGVADDDAFAVGLACGGEIKIAVQPVGKLLPVSLIETRLGNLTNRVESVLSIDLQTFVSDLTAPDAGQGHSHSLTESVFFLHERPNPRLLIVGAVHIAQFLARYGKDAGYDVTVIDPRTGFLGVDRFSDVKLSDAWPDEALQQKGVDAQTAVVVLAHDPKIDDPALHVALGSDAFYIGALGSKRTQEKRHERLSAQFEDAQIKRICGPVGLNLGAKNPAEIAISIMAEMTMLRRGPK